MIHNKKIIFCGCGGLYNYSLGIAKIIQDIIKEQNIDNNKIKYVGVSAGCFPALIMSIEKNIDDLFITYNKSLLDEVNKLLFGSFFIWYKYVRKHTLQNIPNNSFNTKNLEISITDIKNWSNILVNSWENNDDLIDSITASSFLPIFGTYLFTKYKNKKCMDGSFTYNSQQKIDTNNTLYIFPEKWRSIKKNWFYCYSDYNWATKLYKWGQEDAIKNKIYIKEFLINNSG
jgi:hypothetical protein